MEKEYDYEMERFLKAHEEENIRRAEEKEEELLNRPTPILDAFINGIIKLEMLIEKLKRKNKLKNNSTNER